MKDTLIQLSKGVLKGPASDLVCVLFGERPPTMSKKDVDFTPINRSLDHSQVVKSSTVLIIFSYPHPCSHFIIFALLFTCFTGTFFHNHYSD